MIGNRQCEMGIQNNLVHNENQSPKKPLKMLERIGSTIFEVSVYPSETSKETLEDKILRLLEREVRNIA